jgi:hypothetical protein
MENPTRTLGDQWYILPNIILLVVCSKQHTTIGYIEVDKSALPYDSAGKVTIACICIFAALLSGIFAGFLQNNFVDPNSIPKLFSK